jgi:hypothetical protein
MILVFFVAVSSAFVIRGPVGNAAVGRSYPMWSLFTQINLFESNRTFDWMWNQNYSVAVSSSCPPTLSVDPRGKIIVWTQSELSSACTNQQVVNAFNPLGPVGYIMVQSGGSWRSATQFNPYYPVSNELPVWWHGVNPVIPMGTAFLPVNYAGSVLSNPNCSLTLTYPEQNPIMVRYSTHFPGSWSQLPYFAISLGLLAMIFASWKISLFVHLQGVSIYSIPQLVLACNFLGGFFIFLIWGLFGSASTNDFAIVPADAGSALLFFPLIFVFSGMIILGFYFGEIARLSSASSGGFEKMKIPVIIFLSLTALIIIIANIVEASDPVISAQTGNTQLNQFFFAWLGVIVPVAVTGVLVFGCLVLLMAMKDSSNKTPIIRIILIGVICVLSVWIIFAGVFMFYFPNQSLTSPPWSTLTFEEFQGIRSLLLDLGCAIPCIFLSFNFSVAVQKEIEISKSGTSSTTSSKSSSSSSSSSQDPVIEL